jgi:hypothetical protein
MASVIVLILLLKENCRLPFQLVGHHLLWKVKINHVKLRITMVFVDTVVLFLLLLNPLLIIFPLFSVKLRIKSFNIPELFIKVPENATIGSLKVNTRWAYRSYC